MNIEIFGLICVVNHPIGVIIHLVDVELFP